MGCSGSHPVAQPSAPLDAVGPSSGKLAAAGQRDKNAQQQAAAGGGVKSTAAGGPGIVRVKTLQKTGGGLAITTSADSGAAAPTSPAPVAAQKSLARKTSSVAAASASPTIPCDVDETHVATLRCEECEEHFCATCDTAFHRKKNAKHTRTALPGASALTVPSLAITRTPSSSRPSSRPASPHHGDNSSGGGREKGSAAASPTAAAPAPLRAPSHLAPLRKGDGSSPAAASSSLSPFAPLPTASNPGTPSKQQPLLRTRTVTVASLNPNASAGGGGKQPSPPNSKRASLVGEQKEAPAGSALSPSKPSGGATKRMPTFQRSTTMRIGDSKKNVSAASCEDEKVIHAVPVEKLRALGGAQLELIWAQYDSDGNGVLDRKELAMLASDCIARTLTMMEEEIRKQNPGISETQLKNAIEKERAFILPGKGKKEEAHQQMVKHLVRKLDVNGDGSVTRAELMMQWNSFSAGLFQVREQEALECVIM